ncbi:MAG TPA: SLC13 family permease [Vicinamibacterales bacterium]|nr:SLC13 family permease [Vicinamibacterales bacterium]
MSQLATSIHPNAARSPAAPLSPPPAIGTRSVVVLAALAIAAAGFRLLPLGIDPQAHSALAIGIFMIGCWMTQVLDHGIAGILGCFLFWMLGVARFETAFSGFADSTPWFLFGAICCGLMGSKSGLARRLAYLVMRRIGSSYPRLLLGLIVSNFLLTAVVPSGIARVVMMAAIAVGLIEAFGVDRTSNIARGMFVILVYQATIFDKMLIAGAASITARGGIERFGQVDVLWSRWFLAYLPCDLLVMFIAWRIALWLYPPEAAALPGGAEFLQGQLNAMGRWSPVEIKTVALMLVAIALWMTDFLHHIPAPMVGLGIGLMSLMPRIGVLDADDARTINYLPIFFVAATVSLSNVLVQTKALDVVTTALFAWMTPHLTAGSWSTMILYWSAFAYHIVIGNEIAMLSTSLPILMTYARDHAINPLTLGMIWTFGAGPKIFIYESAVLVVGYSYGYFTNRDLIKVGAILSIVTALILLLLVPLYWPLIGITE